jgi:tape measure domain-containing protein
MAESIVKLIVDATQGVRSLGRFKKATDQAAKKADLLKKAVRSQKAATEAATTKLAQFGDIAKSAFDKASKAAQKYQSALGGIKGAIVSLGVAALTKRMIGQAASFQQTQIRLKALSTEYGEFGKIQQLVKDNAKTFNLSQAEASSQFSNIYARLRPLGKTLEEVQTVYKGFNATAIASGTSAAAASGAFLQLSQALGSGRLQGDEFRSVSEQIPGILGLVADEMGVTVDKLKKLGSEGAITSDILINALAKGFEKNKDKIQQILAESPAAKFKEFSNATSELSNAIGTELLPVVTPAVQELTKLLKAAGDLPGPIKTAGGAIFGLVTAVTVLAPIVATLAANMASVGFVVFVAGLIAAANATYQAFAAQADYNRILTESPIDEVRAKIKGLRDEMAKAQSKTVSWTEAIFDFVLGVDGASTAVIGLQRRIDELNEREFELAGGFYGPGFAAPDEPNKPPKRTVPTVIASKPSRAPSAAQAKDITAAMEALLLKEQELRFSNNKLAQSQIQKEIEVQRILESQLQPREKNIALIKAQNDELFRTSSIFSENFKKAAEVDDQIKKTAINAVKAAISQAAEIDAQIEAQGEKMKALYASIGQTISTSIVDSLTAAVDGTKRLSDVASDTLRSLANILLKFGLNTLLGGLAGDDGVGVFSKLFGGGRAKGGTVMGGTSYMVGERGPELFTPGRSGSIAPNSSMGGGANVVVNVDASGTKAEGDGRQANQLGAALGAAVQAELIKQKRPGGLLAA